MPNLDPASFYVPMLAKWMRELADFALRIHAAHTAWKATQPKKGRAKAADCSACRKSKSRKDAKRRKAARDAAKAARDGSHS